MNKKTIAITGSTGGLGKKICFHLARLGYDMIFINRDIIKSKALADGIMLKYPKTNISHITMDLADFNSVKNGMGELLSQPFDTIILNAGIYNVPLKKLNTGYNNVFQVNFISQYYIVKKLLENKNDSLEKIIALGSIAHNYSKLNENDIDFSTYKKASKIYGNSKRFLMFSLFELLKDSNIKLCVAHPGITLTNMTNHYPKIINWLVKIGIKIIFPSPKKASKNIIYALNNNCSYKQWIGPKIFNIWGKPTIKKLKTCEDAESKKIYEIAEKIYKNINI